MQKIVCITGGACGFGTVLQPVDITEIVYWVTTVSPHVNVCPAEVMPFCQSCGPLAIYRES